MRLMTIREEILSWLRRRRERKQRIEARARTLLEELGSEAFGEAVSLERRSKSFGERREWRDVAIVIARMSSRGVETRMAINTDFSDPAAPTAAKIEPRKVDQIGELKRLIGQRPKGE
jgi:sulfite reductase beta subunit-like hemoprotein